MKNYILLSISFLFSGLLQGQTAFQKLYGGNRNERGQTLFSTFDRGYIFNGATTSYGAGDADGMLIKTDADGNVLWAKAYGSAQYDNSEYAIQTSDHGIVGVGRKYLSNGTSDIIVYKTDE